MPASPENESHRASLHRAATQAHADWLAKMSPEERAHLKTLGLDRPPEDSNEVSGHSPYELKDFAESPQCRTEIDVAALIDTPAEILAETHGLTIPQALALIAWCKSEIASAIRTHEAHLLQVIVGGLLAAKNPKLSAAGLAFAANLSALNGLGSQSEYAKDNSVSRSAISKIVKAWQRALGLRASAHQKSEKACAAYSSAATQHHWRNRKASASELVRKLNLRLATA